MSNKRYLEFDSTYRNRNCYPCPAEFITRVTCVKEDNSGLTAHDYVAKEYPTESWYQLSYAGADASDLLNKEYVLGNITTSEYIDIPIVINAKSYASMWPVDWMNGASPTYFSNLNNPNSETAGFNGPIKIGSGAASKTTANGINYINMGTRFQGAICDGTAANRLNSPNNTIQKDQFWTSTTIRNKNILAPEKFSGGTASAPQLGPRALDQGKVKDYFAGAMLFRFRNNPLYDFNTVAGGAVAGPAAATGEIDGGGDNQVTPLVVPNSPAGPLLGSLGFPYFYQTLTFAVPPPQIVKIGDCLKGSNGTETVFGFVACVISQQEIIVRLGTSVPIGGGIANTITTTGTSYTQPTSPEPWRNLFPGCPPNLQPLVGGDVDDNAFALSTVVIGNYNTTPSANWGVPSSITGAYPAYFWCGYVESAIITGYNQNTGIVTLDTPFTNSGTNGFDTSNDFYLIDFNTDPSGHWNSQPSTGNPYTNINSGKPRVFFPGGAAIPNYYSGREITSASREQITGPRFALQDVKVSNYDFVRRTLFLDRSIVPTSPSYRGIDVCSQYTLVFLNQPIGEELPAGTKIAWNGSGAGADGGTFDNPTSGTLTSGFLAPGVLFPAINYAGSNPLAGATAGVYNCIPTTTTGTGVGAVLLVTINVGSVIGGVQVVSSGGGYGVGDTITIPASQITGATADLVITIGASQLFPGAPVPWYLSPGVESTPPGPTIVETIPGQYFVAINAPKGATCIVLQGSRDPQRPTTAPFTSSLLNMLGGPVAGGVGPGPGYSTAAPYTGAGSVSLPPWASETSLSYWRNPTNWSNLTPDPEYPLNTASLLGAQTIIARGKVPVEQSNNLVPYIPESSISVPGNCPATVRENGVIELQIIDGGNSYKITDPTMPIMALIAVPTGPDPWNPANLWPSMQPYPENFTDADGNKVYTFLNICFVNVKSVGAGGEILELEINSPGDNYPPGSTVYIVDGTGANVSTYDAQAAPSAKWIPGPGRGARARVVSSGQFIGIAGGEQFPLNGVPRMGDLLYMVTYGWGMDDSEKTLYNSSPDVGVFLPNYSGVLNNQFLLETSDIPRKLQDCLDEESTYPETGTRKILHSMRSINNQVLIRPSVTNWTSTPVAGGGPGPIANSFQTLQYAAPGAYLGGNTAFELNNGLRPFGEAKNSVLWIAIENGFNLSSFKGNYAFSRDGFVNGNYTFAGTPGLLQANLGSISTAPLIPRGIPSQAQRTMQWSDARDAPMGQLPPPPVPGGFIQGGLQLSNSITGNWIQLLTFDRDNEQPLNYTGSTVSQNQTVCYEVELISLILPNLPLDNTIGGLIAFYPYLYVELSNKTAPSAGTKGILYSNNPNANRALFRVAVDDTPTPVISKFIKVDGDGAVQTIKFKPNDNLYLRVFLQNGTLFKTQDNDTSPPSPPDPFVQISAEFSIKRLT